MRTEIFVKFQKIFEQLEKLALSHAHILCGGK